MITMIVVSPYTPIQNFMEYIISLGKETLRALTSLILLLLWFVLSKVKYNNLY
jgi:hypothetical protein